MLHVSTSRWEGTAGGDLNAWLEVRNFTACIDASLAVDCIWQKVHRFVSHIHLSREMPRYHVTRFILPTASNAMAKSFEFQSVSYYLFISQTWRHFTSQTYAIPQQSAFGGRIPNTMDEEQSSIAAPKVLSIPELLEAILIDVPSQTLILSQRVNKKFKAIIEDSTKIQQKLFYTRPPGKDADNTININPLLVRIIKYHSSSCYVGVLRKFEKFNRMVQINEDTYGKDLCVTKARVNFMLIEEDINVESPQLPLRNGSFENMLLADSPICVMVSEPRRGFKVIGKNEGNTVLTMHDILEGFRDFYRTATIEDMEEEPTW